MDYELRRRTLEVVDIGPRPGDLEWSYWPVPGGGCFSAHHLRIIADELDRRNRVDSDGILDSVRDAQRNGVCRLCGEDGSPRRTPDGNVDEFVLNFGREFAHRSCIEREKQADDNVIVVSTTNTVGNWFWSQWVVASEITEGDSTSGDGKKKPMQMPSREWFERMTKADSFDDGDMVDHNDSCVSVGGLACRVADLESSAPEPAPEVVTHQSKEGSDSKEEATGNGIRTERVVLDITINGNQLPAEWPWDQILRPLILEHKGESVRVVDLSERHAEFVSSETRRTKAAEARAALLEVKLNVAEYSIQHWNRKFTKAETRVADLEAMQKNAYAAEYVDSVIRDLRRERETAIERRDHLEEGLRVMKDAADTSCILLDRQKERSASLEAERDAIKEEHNKLRASVITQSLTADRFASAVQEADELRARVAEMEVTPGEGSCDVQAAQHLFDTGHKIGPFMTLSSVQDGCSLEMKFQSLLEGQAFHDAMVRFFRTAPASSGGEHKVTEGDCLSTVRDVGGRPMPEGPAPG
jgi:hypothetical protein